VVIHRFGRIRTIKLSCIAMFISIVAFAAITHLKSNFMFIVLSFFTRVLQGAANIGICVTIYTVAGNFYTQNRNLMIGLLEAAAGLGMMLGPLIGTGLYAIGGYNFMFYSFGSLFLIIVFVFPYVLPKMLDLHTDDDY